MSEQNQLQKRTTNEIFQQEGLRAQNLPVVPIEQQFGISLEGLTEEQQNALRYKMVQSCVNLKVDTIEAQNRLVISSAEMNQTIQNANALSQTKSDFSVQSEHKTATGSANIKVSCYKNSSLGIIVCVIGVILILALVKGC